MLRYSLKKDSEGIGCSYCDLKTLGIITDRKTGNEFWVCKEHCPNLKERVRRKLAHFDFKGYKLSSKAKETILNPYSHRKL